MFEYLLTEQRSDISRSMEEAFEETFNKLWTNFIKDIDSFPLKLDKSRFPKVNISLTDDGYEIEAFVPFVKKEDLTITTEKDTLTIKGKSHQDSKKSKSDYLIREISRTSFVRSWSFSNVNFENVSAKLADGVLTIKIPFKEKPKKEDVVKKVEIK